MSLCLQFENLESENLISQSKVTVTRSVFLLLYFPIVLFSVPLCKCNISVTQPVIRSFIHLSCVMHVTNLFLFSYISG